jgi:hypothetical protein
VSNPQNTVQSPRTPVTSVTTQGIITNQATQCFDQRGVLGLQKNVQKLSKVTHVAFSNGILQRGQIQFLMRINDESKTRRSAKGHILRRRLEKGQGAVMGFDELEAARAEHAGQAVATAAKAKGKRKGKPKGTAGREPQA